ncbi:aldose epimerase family protein [Gayadomonas joobiniege]|uniref:aldose epimerase family protein n=1 Tax=Gayadomonas joobiniege TaxID=1234606 RepID=UPI000368E30A|nr:aldose epimerase family protein [Gayadomonas joobiniege]
MKPFLMIKVSLLMSALYTVAVQAEMSIKRTQFGQYQGQQVYQYHLQNSHGMQLKISNYGATLTSLKVPDKDGKIAEITAGFDQFDSYFSDEYNKNNPYFGGVVGRYASFLRDGRYQQGGHTYQLSKNAGEHHLHGGTKGLDKRMWQLKRFYQSQDAAVLQLVIQSPSGQEGYPGNLAVVVEYQLTEQNEIRIRYLATTDKTTPLSLTHHAYFNLNGFENTVLDHKVQIDSNAYLKPGADNILDGTLAKVSGTAADFGQAKYLKDAFKTLKSGFEHYYVFDNPEAKLKKVATISHAISGRSMQVYTTEPGALLYTGRYTSDKLAREDGTQYGQYKAICFETSKYPNGPNIKNSPRTFLQPGEIYDETTVFAFAW